MIETFGAAAAPLLAAIHAQAFDDPWSEAEFATLLASPGVTALVFAQATETPHGPGPLHRVPPSPAPASQGRIGASGPPPSTEEGETEGAEGAWSARTPAGFILLRVVADEAEILTIAVLPQARRRGVGRELLETAAKTAGAAGAARLFLEVASDNEAARGLYAAAGFAEVGRRRGYYARPVGAADAHVLAREL